MQSAGASIIDQGLTFVFDVALTGEKGWIAPTIFKADYFAETLSHPPQVILVATIPSTEGAVIAFNTALHGLNYQTQWPVIRFFVEPDSFQLENLGSFVIQSVDVEVGVKGVKNLVLQNDESVQAPDKPVSVFGSQPAISSNFYIGSAEVFSKTVQSLSLALEWKDLPDDFTAYY